MEVKRIRRRTRAAAHKAVQQKLKSKGQQKDGVRVNLKNRKTVIIAQEIKFARLLVNKEKRVRDKILKNLRKWLTVRSKSSFGFSEADFMRLWKGLFYCMWMSDKPLIQEDLAESLSKIVHCFQPKDVILLYTTCALRTLALEWFGIDQYRIDKFAMLARRIIRQTFFICKEKCWDIEWVKGISELIEQILLDPKSCQGFCMHITEVYLEELSKVSDGNVPEDVVTIFIKPFARYMVIIDDERQLRHIMRHIFRYLIIQSDVGMDYMEKFKAWRQAGFPAGHIDAMERIEIPDNDDSKNDEEDNFMENGIKSKTNKALDPRAGRVDVELPQIPFNAQKIVELLSEYKFHPLSTSKARRQVLRLIKEFTELAQNRMPLGVKEVKVPRIEKKETNPKLAALRLLAFEHELYSDNKQVKKRKKKNTIIEDNFNKGTIPTSSDENALEKVLIPRKNRKEDCKVNSCDQTEDMNLQLDLTINSHKKKKRVVQDKVQNNHNITESNCPVEDSKICRNNVNQKRKTAKVKQNGISTLNLFKITTPIKRKKSPNVNMHGTWEVSDNVIPTTSSPLALNNADLSTESDGKSVLDKPVVKSDLMLNKDAMWLVPVLKKLRTDEINLVECPKKDAKSTNETTPKKRVKIVLQRNTAHHTSEYIQQLRQSPAIPFDANKKPLAGVLKASPIPSPVNPFYKKHFKCGL
ncbi:hypothetical protein KM043_005293 [Ampulex compressa]|nr:hypothetical protein KM043_005293 [Ampulex compressa]